MKSRPHPPAPLRRRESGWFLEFYENTGRWPWRHRLAIATIIAFALLLLMAAIAVSHSDRPQSRRWFQQALQMWDGRGFHDTAMDNMARYATYKLSLAVLAIPDCRDGRRA